MGVPKFFRWISARYPCINQVIKHDEDVFEFLVDLSGHSIPEIDHLYLDMNGILHNCSHPEGVSKVMSEDVIFENVRNYVEMTQQRARRFQSAQEAKEEAAIALRKGQTVKEHFDSCVISPGTEFMERMHNALKDYISGRVLNSDEWRNINVYLSGHDCPGEGEHKIREFIAYCREQPSYTPNERHCIYGMDADLIFLGLTTHELNVCILRENVIKARTCLAEATPFCITYVMLVREYIDCEFNSLKANLPFPYNLEHIIDDWIFMAFLLGNDFIPHLPNLHIHAESLLLLWDTYHVVLPKLDGYLVEFGRLNLARFDRYLEELSKFEQQWFEEREADHRWMRGKRGHEMARQLETLGQDKAGAGGSGSAVKSTDVRPVLRSGSSPAVGGDLDEVAGFTGFFGPDRGEPLEADCPDEYEDLLQEGVISFLPDSRAGLSMDDSNLSIVHTGMVVQDGHSDVDGESDHEEDSEYSDEDELVYRMHRRDYYFTKLSLQIDQQGCSGGATSDTETVLLPLVRDYVRMLQWILSYYFLQVADWQFFYSYHYAPFACDLRIFTKAAPHGNGDWAEFASGTKPIKPFVQQLMIMPPDAAYIVPEAYRDVMTSPNSPLAPFFPREFSTDLNGKISTWEAVALIPFIDETVLDKTMAPLHKLLSKAELQRNQHKHHLMFPTSIGLRNQPMQKLSHDFFRKSIPDPGALLPVFYAGLKHRVAADFPSLFRLKFTTAVMKIPVHVFEQPSRLDSLVLRVPGHKQCQDLSTLAEQLLGRPTCVRWPYPAIVMPVRLMTADQFWELKDYNISPEKLKSLPNTTSAFRHQSLDSSDTALNSQWLFKQTSSLYRHYRVRRAIIVDSDGEDPSQAPETPPVLLFSRRLEGWYVKRVKQRGQPTVTLAPVFGTSPAANGSELKATTTATVANNTLKCSRPWPGRRPAPPSIQMEPAFGQLCGLSLDLLDMVIPGEPEPVHVRRCPLLADKTAFGLDSIFSVGQVVICLVPQHYGQAGEVTGWTPKSLTVNVRFYPPRGAWIDTSYLRANSKSFALTDCSLDTHALAGQLGVPSFVVARITGTLFVQRLGDTEAPASPSSSANKKVKGYNIGLNLRNRTKSQFIGWSRFCPIRKTWFFSDRTRSLLFDYLRLYSNLWLQLSEELQHQECLSKAPLALDLTENQIASIQQFLAESPHSTTESIPNQGEYLYGNALQQLCAHVSEMQSNGSSVKPLDRKKWMKESPVPCSPESLLLMGGCLPRLMSLICLTWISHQALQLKEKEGEASQFVEVMFDFEFPGAIDIRGCGPRCARLQRSSLVCLPKSYLLDKFLRKNFVRKNRGPVPGNNRNDSSNNNNKASNHHPQTVPATSKLQSPPRQSKATAKETGDSPVVEPKVEPVLTSSQKQKLSYKKSEVQALNALLSACRITEKPVASAEGCSQPSVHLDRWTPKPSSVSVSSNATSDDSVLPPLPPTSWSISDPVEPTDPGGGTGRKDKEGSEKRPTSPKVPVKRSASSPHTTVHRNLKPNATSRQVNNSPAHPPSYGEFNRPPPLMGNYPLVGYYPHYHRQPGHHQPINSHPAQPPYGPVPYEHVRFAYGSGYPAPVPYYGGGMVNVHQYSYPGPPPPPPLSQGPRPPLAPTWLPPPPQGCGYPTPSTFRPMMPLMGRQESVASPRRPRGFIPPQVTRKRCP